jgi:hypothetical protein
MANAVNFGDLQSAGIAIFSALILVAVVFFGGRKIAGLFGF